MADERPTSRSQGQVIDRARNRVLVRVAAHRVPAFEEAWFHHGDGTRVRDESDSTAPEFWLPLKPCGVKALVKAKVVPNEASVRHALLYMLASRLSDEADAVTPEADEALEATVPNACRCEQEEHGPFVCPDERYKADGPAAPGQLCVSTDGCETTLAALNVAGEASGLQISTVPDYWPCTIASLRVLLTVGVPFKPSVFLQAAEVLLGTSGEQACAEPSRIGYRCQ